MCVRGSWFIYLINKNITHLQDLTAEIYQINVGQGSNPIKKNSMLKDV